MKNDLRVRGFVSDYLLALFGVVFFLSTAFNWLASNKIAQFAFIIDGAILLSLIAGSIVSPLLFFKMRKMFRAMINRSALSLPVKNMYQRYDTFTYSTLLLPLLGSLGVQSIPTAWVIMALIFLLTQFLLIYSLMDKKHKDGLFLSTGWFSFLFFVSGFAAIIYQITWQRALFTAFGVNIESITIIVSIFMFGLGVGSLIGGMLSKKFPGRLLQLFLIFELIIGMFGVISLPLIKSVSEASIHSSLFLTALVIFGLLGIPTIFMGATLPVLATYVHRHYRNIGKSVGTLYFFNTLGSAVACFITADVLFALFGKQASIFIAAVCNFIVASLVYLYTCKTKSAGSDQATLDINENLRGQTNEGQRVRFAFVLLLSFMTGYISLSQEILWFRAISYATGGSPHIFAYVLGFFLAGIASGANFAKRVCENKKEHTLTFIAIMLSLSSVIYFVSMPITSYVMITFSSFGMFTAYLFIGITAFLMGGIFPLLCHFGVNSGKYVGASLSWVYFANIIGSTAGTLLTGFILMNLYTLEQNILALSLFTIVVAGIVWCSLPFNLTVKAPLMTGVVLAIVGFFFVYEGLYAHILEKLHFRNPGQQYKYIVQNRSGIITVEPGKVDTVYGGGTYDGKYNTDPVLDANLITRAYMIAALHDHPEDVLQIGLSSGSWARVIASHTEVKRLTIVEINPGYIELVKKYPQIAVILEDPKVTMHVDDGRRWLKRNPDRKFDIIVSNTTLHWRDGITNLLSSEFLRLCKKHLKAGGVIYYNSTFSENVPFTAAKEFKYVTRYLTLVAASDSPFVMQPEERLRNLLKFQGSGGAALSGDAIAFNSVLRTLAAKDLLNEADSLRNKKNLWHITDDNMATEFKVTNRWVEQKAKWDNLFKNYIGSF